MTIRTFWTIFMKILGIWLVLDSITVIPQFFSALFFTDRNNIAKDFAFTAIVLLLTIGLYIFILRLFVFRTTWLINKLHLEKGFDEEKIDLNIQLPAVLILATIVIGGIIFIESLPQLCKEIFIFFQQKNMFKEHPASGKVIFYFVKTVLGYLLIANSKQVVTFINKQTAKQNGNNE